MQPGPLEYRAGLFSAHAAFFNQYALVRVKELIQQIEVLDNLVIACIFLAPLRPLSG